MIRTIGLVYFSRNIILTAAEDRLLFKSSALIQALAAVDDPLILYDSEVIISDVNIDVCV
jgi:hypothetical protein